MRAEKNRIQGALKIQLGSTEKMTEGAGSMEDFCKGSKKFWTPYPEAHICMYCCTFTQTHRAQLVSAFQWTASNQLKQVKCLLHIGNDLAQIIAFQADTRCINLSFNLSAGNPVSLPKISYCTLLILTDSQMCIDRKSPFKEVCSLLHEICRGLIFRLDLPPF